MSEYQPLSSLLWERGDRHRERAREHMAAGRIDYARGSLAKAMRSYSKALDVDEASAFPPLMQVALQSTRAAIEQNIFGTFPN